MCVPEISSWLGQATNAHHILNIQDQYQNAQEDREPHQHGDPLHYDLAEISAYSSGNKSLSGY